MNTETSTRTVQRTPAIDIWEDGAEAVLAANIPGVSQEDASVQVEAGILTLEGQTLRGPEGSAGEQTRIIYRRQLALDDSIDPAAITATVRNGVLTVKLPKRAERKPRTIEVKAA